MNASATPIPRETAPSDRRFVATPPAGWRPESPRRIWEVEPGAVFVTLGVLIERRELETVFLDVEGEDRSAHREDVMLRDAVRHSARPGRFAEVVERLLDTRTRRVRRQISGSPMSELAAWWLGAKDEGEGPRLTALLWNLARDRRCVVQPLLEMVRSDIWVRALGLLGERRPPRPLLW